MLKQYISDKFKLCIRENQNDDGTLIGLPYPYTVPCISDAFQEMYYWDTYFTNIGLIYTGNIKQAINNVDNMLFLISKYGFMPNGNRTFYLKNSQPPFLSLMVKTIFDITKDKVWLQKTMVGLEKEYEFWMSRRTTSIELNKYGVNRENPDCVNMPKLLIDRLGFTPPINDTEKQIEQFVSSCESGWDLSPRFEFEAFNYAPIDLNSLLYALEKNMSDFCFEIGSDDTVKWSERAKKRYDLMNRYMLDENEIFLDYNFVHDKFSPVFSVASFYPMFVKLATNSQAQKLVEKLPEIETEYGILTCAKNNVRGRYQWNYPNGWAPLHYIVIDSLLNYGYDDDAKRIAKKYVETVEKNFKITNNLWEKYNVIDGSINTESEYETPPMLGWTAGVYLYALKVANS